MPQKYKYIVYNWFGEKRKMVVVDGQPYYQSIHLKVWLPFIMISGDYLHVNLNGLPTYLSREILEALIEETHHLVYGDTYILKFSHLIFEKMPTVFEGIDLDLKENELAGRLPSRKTLITSICLTGLAEFPPDLIERANLTTEEKSLIQQPITLSDRPSFESSNPHKINRWLISKGAVIAGELLLTKAMRQYGRTVEDENRHKLFSTEEKETEKKLFGDVLPITPKKPKK